MGSYNKPSRSGPDGNIGDDIGINEVDSPHSTGTPPGHRNKTPGPSSLSLPPPAPSQPNLKSASRTLSETAKPSDPKARQVPPKTEPIEGLQSRSRQAAQAFEQSAAAAAAQEAAALAKAAAQEAAARADAAVAEAAARADAAAQADAALASAVEAEAPPVVDQVIETKEIAELKAGLERKEIEKRNLAREIKDLKRTLSERDREIKDLSAAVKDLNTAASKKKKDNIVTAVTKIVKDLTELLAKD